MMFRVNLCGEKDEPLFFKSNYNFEVFNLDCDNICTLLSTLCPCPDIMLTLLKRILFNASNIITSQDEVLLKKCILGVLELFYPLTLDIVTVPVIPQSLMEYMAVCDHSIIGIVQNKDESSDKKDRWFESLFEIQQDNSCQINLDQHK
jgi:hypothetical protein